MPTLVTLGATDDTVTLSEGPVYKINGGASTAWNDQIIDGGLGFDTLVVNESSTKTSYFSLSMAADGLVTFTAASGSGSKTVSVSNFEKISFWDITAYLGTAGNDSLTGTSSVESIYGFDGDDTIDGGAGADKMYGGNGNDTYVISGLTDVVSELSGAGTDTVSSAITYSLVDTDGAGVNGGNVENLVLTGNAAINGTGNALNNVLTGNSGVNNLSGGAGNDTLDGGAGIDVLAGGAGNDVYIVDQTSETVTELAGEGKDSVKSSVSFTLGDNIENLTLTGLAAIDGTGNTGKNVIVGNKAANIITGGRGADTMTGGAGADTFDFNSILDAKPGASHDKIKDFVHLVDHIDLSNIDANTTTGGNAAFTFIATLDAAFTNHAGELRAITSGANTVIEGDVDGNGVADFQIELTGSIALTFADFIL